MFRRHPCCRMPHTTNLCFRDRSDMANGRALSSSSYVSATAMTEEACAAFCGAGGFKYAGVEYSQECCEWTLFSLTTRIRFRRIVPCRFPRSCYASFVLVLILTMLLCRLRGHVDGGGRG